jgi:hypothetical protein
MRDLTTSNGWYPPLRGVNQPFDQQVCHDNQMLRIHYPGKLAGQLTHYI